nr:serine/threonine-protein kinase [Candidatus Njordarchaeota archaeon]
MKETPRLIVSGLVHDWTFDVEPMKVVSANDLYVTIDKKHIIKIVDTEYITHFRGISNYFNPRLTRIKNNVITIAQSKGFDLDCFRGAVGSWEKAFPIDYGPARLDGVKRDAGIVSNFLSGHTLSRSLAAGMKLGKDDVKKLIRKLVYEVAIIHMNDIVHMDLTPGNIILDENKRDIYIIDWDIAQISDSDITQMMISFPAETMIPLPPGFDPGKTRRAPDTFFDIWYLPVDILAIIATFDRDMNKLFASGIPSPMFFVDFPTPEKLIELRHLLEKDKKARRRWPPEYDNLRNYRYYRKEVKREHLDHFNEYVSRYLNPELFHYVYLDASDGKKHPTADDLNRFV